MSTGRRLAVAIALLPLLGCGLNFDPQPNPTQYYLMSAIPSEPTASPAMSDLTLGVGPLWFSPYLRRDKLVTRVEPNEVVFAEFERWAEPFDVHVERVMGQALLNLLAPLWLVPYPWIGSDRPQLRVEATFWRFDRMPDGGAELEVDWLVRDTETDEILVEGHEVIRGEVTTTGNIPTDDSVAAMSQALAQLNATLAKAVRQAAAGR
jgi:uncharacterized lipoprotein YmbA